MWEPGVEMSKTLPEVGGGDELLGMHAAGADYDEQVQDDALDMPEVPCAYHCLRYFWFLLFFWWAFFAGFKAVEPREGYVVLLYGRVWKVITEPGLRWFIPFGLKFIQVSTKTNIMEIDVNQTKIADLNGSPVQVGAVVTYCIQDPVKAAVNVQNVAEYVNAYASTVLRGIVAQYPYESRDPHAASLKNCGEQISQRLKMAMQRRVVVAGVEVQSFDLSDLKYSVEIAAAMLIKQQAQATIDARETIVQGGVEMVGAAIEGLAKRGVRMTSRQASSCASNLLCVLCSDSKES